MIQRILPALCLLLAAFPLQAQTPDPQPNPEARTEAGTEVPAVQDMPTQEILVVGSRPGPGLWKVSKDGHVLWVFGSYAPLPKDLQWRSQQVEAILAEAQEYLPSPAAKVEAGFFKTVAALPFLIGVKKNPEGARLQDVLPPEVHARWLPLKKKYLGDDEDVERERPLFASDALFNAALKQSGLVQGTVVNKAIEKLVEKRKLKTTPSVLALAIDSPYAVIKDFKKTSVDDQACFSKTIDRLESDLEGMRLRAQAWAIGDIEEIRKLKFESQEASCNSAVLNNAVAKGQPGVQDLEERMRSLWIANAEKALAANAVSFGVLRLEELLSPQGPMARLAASGYTVEPPK